MSGTRFMVQWEEHPSHLASRLGQLLEHQTLVDVTLMCNTHTLKVHRAVLAACSPYFETLLQSIFQRQLGQHPLIVLKDMQFSVLKSLIEFMYCGETNVTEDDLGALLQAARFFQVKGLSSMSREALGIPAPKSKSTVNGDTTKVSNKARTVEPENKVITQTTIETNQAVPEEPTINEKLVSRQGPEASADTAQVLLSLSGEIDTIRANSKEDDKVAAEDAAMAVAKAQEEEEAAAASAEVANAVHSANQAAPVAHSPQVPPGGYPIYVPGPRKRGRPLKRQMNLIFQEKVMTDAEMALRKEAEASRKALEALQKEMCARDSPTVEAPSNIGVAGRSRGGRNVVQHRVQQVTHVGQAKPAQQARERVGNPSSGNVITTTPANQSTNATAAVANVTNSTAGGTVMTQYMEVLKEAGLPTDVPILMDSGDGSFVTVNEEVLMNIVSGGVIQCHVEEGGNIATFTPGDARVMTAEVQEDSAEGVVQVVEGQNEMENDDHRELMNVKEDGLTIQGQVRGQDMPSVDGDEGVGEGNIAFSENETVVQEVEGKVVGEGGGTIYMVVEDGSGAVEDQQVISHDGVPLCKVNTETVDGKTMYLVTRDATKTMQCAISEGALVVSEGDVVQGISIASDVELERSDKNSLVKKVEYEKLVHLPSLEDNDNSIQDTVVPTPQEDKSAEGNITTHVTELSKSSEEIVSMASNDANTESDEVHGAEGKEKLQPSGEYEEFVTEVASGSSIVSKKRKSLDDPLPALNKRIKEEEEEDSLVLVLKDDEMDENSANAVENQTEFIIASSETTEVCKEQLQDSLSSAVGDFQGKVELATGPRREGRSLPMLQDSDEDIKSSTM